MPLTSLTRLPHLGQSEAATGLDEELQATDKTDPRTPGNGYLFANRRVGPRVPILPMRVTKLLQTRLTCIRVLSRHTCSRAVEKRCTTLPTELTRPSYTRVAHHLCP